MFLNKRRRSADRTRQNTYRPSLESLEDRLLLCGCVYAYANETIAVPDFYTTSEETTLTVPAPGVLANDVKLYGAGPKAQKLTDPLNGALTFSGNGSFSYTPNAGFRGVDVFTYRLDYTGRVDTIIIPSVSHPGIPAPTTVTITVLPSDNDEPLPSLAISNVSQNEGNGGSTAFLFTVTLSQASPQTVTVHYATSDGSAKAGEDYTAASGTLSFEPGETSKIITVQGKGDRTKEADETFFVNLTAASNATIEDAQAIGTILDDDR